MMNIRSRVADRPNGLDIRGPVQ